MKGSFTLKNGATAINQFAKKMVEARIREEKMLEFRVKTATNIVYRVAHQRRPYITNLQAKLEGRRLIGKGKYHRVSDPNASQGVPVAMIDGGTLQASVKQEFRKLGSTKFQGRVFVDNPGAEYAQYLEFGTSKMKARPFMRPAVNTVKEAIKMMLRKHA